MKKRALSLLLVFVMALGLAIPALAAPEAPAGLEEPEAPVEAVAEEPAPAAIAPISEGVPAPVAAGEPVAVPGVDGMTFTVAGVEDQNETAAAVTDAVKHGFWGGWSGELYLDGTYSVEGTDMGAIEVMDEEYRCTGWGSNTNSRTPYHFYRFQVNGPGTIPSFSVTLKKEGTPPTAQEVKYEGWLAAEKVQGVDFFAPGETLVFYTDALGGDGLAFSENCEVTRRDNYYVVHTTKDAKDLTVSLKKSGTITYEGEGAESGIFGEKVETAVPGETVTIKVKRGFTLSAVKGATVPQPDPWSDDVWLCYDPSAEKMGIAYEVQIEEGASEVTLKVEADKVVGTLQYDGGVKSVGHKLPYDGVPYTVPITDGKLYNIDLQTGLLVTVQSGYVVQDAEDDNYVIGSVTGEEYTVNPAWQGLFNGPEDVMYIKTRQPVSILVLIDEDSQGIVDLHDVNGNNISSGTRILEGQKICYTVKDGYEGYYITRELLGKGQIEDYYEMMDTALSVVNATNETVLKFFAHKIEEKSIQITYKNEEDAKQYIVGGGLKPYGPDGALRKTVSVYDDRSISVRLAEGYVLDVEGGSCVLVAHEPNGPWDYLILLDEGVDALTVEVKEDDKIKLTWEVDAVTELTVAGISVQKGSTVNAQVLQWARIGAGEGRDLIQCKLKDGWAIVDTDECRSYYGAREDGVWVLLLSDEKDNDKTITIKAIDFNTTEMVNVTIDGDRDGFISGQYTFEPEGGGYYSDEFYDWDTAVNIPRGSELSIALAPGYALDKNSDLYETVLNPGSDIAYNVFYGMIVNDDETYTVVKSDETKVELVPVTLDDPNGFIKKIEFNDGMFINALTEFSIMPTDKLTVTVPKEVKLTVDGGTSVVTHVGSDDRYDITLNAGAKKMTITVALQDQYLPPTSGNSGYNPGTPSPSPSPSTSPSPSPSPTPTPGGDKPTVPVDPPKTNSGTGWSYDYDTGEWYFFKKGEVVANYWVGKIDGASQWDKNWYYVGADGKMLTGMQYIDDLHGGYGWYFLQPTNDHGEAGKMLTGWQWVGGDYGECYFSKKNGEAGKCTWSEKLGDWTGAAWSK